MFSSPLEFDISNQISISHDTISITSNKTTQYTVRIRNMKTRILTGYWPVNYYRSKIIFISQKAPFFLYNDVNLIVNEDVEEEEDIQISDQVKFKLFLETTRFR